MEGNTLPVTHVLRRQHGFMKSIATVVLVAFVSLYLQPLALAAQLPPAAPAAKPAPASNEEKLARTLEDIEDRLGKYEERLTRKEDATRDHDELKRLRKDLDELDRQALGDFEKIGKHLKDKNLPEVILKRHYDAVNQYQQEMAVLKANLDELEAEPTDQGKKPKALKAKAHLKAKQKRRAHSPLDPDNLPFRVPDGDIRKPAESNEEFEELGFYAERRVQVASAELLPGMLSGVLVAAALPSAQDLASTEDVQITDEIRSLAADLRHSPVEIYNWVHNNIRFAPTYGSIQGSQLCLESKQCNAFDTSNLLVALLRAANIPARYVHGTIEVPSEQVMNWVGGVTAPQAAQQLLGKGGVPNTGRVQGGRVTHIRLEHVWVEAYVDFYPSRGAVQKQGDSWVSMDGAFKQYRYTAGMDVTTAVPIDADRFAQDVFNSATWNADEAWMTGISQTVFETHLADFSQRLRDFVDGTDPNATLDDVIGSKEIVQVSRTVLAGGLPYRVVARGSSAHALTSLQRHKIHFLLYRSALDRAMDLPSFSFQASLPSLRGGRVTLSFVAATQADKNVIDSFGGSPSASLPGYLVNVRPVVKVDGTEVARGDSMQVGAEVTSVSRLWSPSHGWVATDGSLIAGEVAAIGINYSGVTLPLIQRMAARNQSLIDQAGGDPASPLAAERLLGHFLNSTLFSYFAAVDAFGSISGRVNGVVQYSLPSTGTFSTSMSVSYWFGLPRAVSLSGLLMDVGLLQTQVMARDNDAQKTTAFVRAHGILASGLEHAIPGATYAGASSAAATVSAVKALHLASQQGIRIYQVDASNVDATLPSLVIRSDDKAAIRNAALAGKEITVQQRPVSVGSWTGIGYVVVDPTTGSGAYLISGGANGSNTDAQDDITLWDLIWETIKETASQASDFFMKLYLLKAVFDFFFDLTTLFLACANDPAALALVAFAFTAVSLIFAGLAWLTTPFLGSLLIALIGFVVVALLLRHLLMACALALSDRWMRNERQRLPA